MSELVAGRELDAEVAERVMGDVGWDIVIEGCSRVGRYFETREEAAAYRETIRDKWHVGPVVLHSDVPRYSEDIDAAWQVVERMRACPGGRFGSLRMVAYSYNRTYATFDAQQWHDDGAWIEANGPHATPLAICLAALNAVESAHSEVGRQEPREDIAGVDHQKT